MSLENRPELTQLFFYTDRVKPTTPSASSHGPRSATASPLVSSTSTPHKSRRRSSMTLLRNIPSSELADIINGNSPNPILDTPPVDLTNDEPSQNEAVPTYQHSLHSLLRKQLSNKRKPMRDRRSLPNMDAKPEADKDVIEMNLDAETDGLPPNFDTIPQEDSKSGAPVYPAMLLNETDHKEDSYCTTTLRDRTSVPDMLHWDDKRPYADYFSNEPVTSTASCKVYRKGVKDHPLIFIVLFSRSIV